MRRFTHALAMIAGIVSDTLLFNAAYDSGKEKGLAEGFANGREREREAWEAKPKPEPRVIEVKVPIPVETVKVIEVPYAVKETKIEFVDRIVEKYKVIRVLPDSSVEIRDQE